MADIRCNHCIKLIKLTFFVPFLITKNGIFHLQRFLYSTQCVKTRIEWLKRIIAAVIRTCIFGDAATFINKDCRVLFGDIFIVPFLGPALGWTAMCSPGWGNLVAIDWMKRSKTIERHVVTYRGKLNSLCMLQTDAFAIFQISIHRFHFDAFSTIFDRPH